MRAPNLDTVSTKLHRIATLARQIAGAPLRTLAHHIDMDVLREAYRRTRKDGAVGVDQQTAQEYAEDLEGNLQSLLDRAKSGTLPGAGGPAGAHPERERRAADPPDRDPDLRGQSAAARRRHGARGGLRAGVPGLLVRVSARPLRPSGAGGCSGRGSWRCEGGGYWSSTSRSFFDTLDHGQLRAVLRQRVQDGVLLRLIGKWLQRGGAGGGAAHTTPRPARPRGG